MKKLIADPAAFYTPKKRPSGHDIGAAFGKDNGGAIPSNLLQIPNSESNGQYVTGCNTVGAKHHPARFPEKLPEFFIRFLTDPGDLVLDIFAGSNTTGAVAEREGRRWLGFELELEYVAASAFRFIDSESPTATMREMYQRILRREEVDVAAQGSQLSIFEKPDRHYHPAQPPSANSTGDAIKSAKRGNV